MKKRYINASLLILIVLIIAFAGFYAGQKYMPHSTAHGDIHSYLHHTLNLTPDQDTKLNKIETKYHGRKEKLEKTIRIANMELAAAIKETPSFSPKVQKSIDKIHESMGELQKASLEHLFEMQPILTPEQNKKLNKLITDALTENAKTQD